MRRNQTKSSLAVGSDVSEVWSAAGGFLLRAQRYAAAHEHAIVAMAITIKAQISFLTVTSVARPSLELNWTNPVLQNNCSARIS